MFGINLKPVTFPLAMFVIVIMAYGLLIPSLGFYGDDWSYIYYHKLIGFDGPGGFADFDRPFSAPFYNVTISILGLSPLPYHIFLLILRWLSAVLLWQVLIKIWPQREKAVIWMAVLFALYPGFSQQPIAVEYILHFSGLALYLLSLLLMLNSLQPSRWRWAFTLAGILCAANLFAIEYFIGLELLRPLILWMGLSTQKMNSRQRLRITMLHWLPYLMVVGAFVVWRVFFFQFPTYQPSLLERFRESPLDAIVYLVKRILLDFKIVLVDAWRRVLRFPDSPGNRILYGLAMLISFLTLVMVQFRRKETRTKPEDIYRLDRDWAIQPILLGGFALLAAGWPFWITGIRLEMGFPWDRPTLPFILGASLFVVGLGELLIRSYYRGGFYLILACFAVGFHVVNAEVYQKEWSNTKDFFWQLTWRAPGLKTGTVLASDDIPLYRVGDSALTAPLNWIYAPEIHTPDLSYKLFDLNIRIGTEYSGIPGFEEGLPIRHDYRSTRFSSTTSSLLVFYYPEDGCLRILSPSDQSLSFLPAKVKQLAPLSKPDLIVVEDTPVHLPEFFYPEPELSWCYYFQKADLARQKQEWKQVIDLEKTASEIGLRPENPSEWLIFIEGYAVEKDLEKAVKLTQKMAEEEQLIPILCNLWVKLLEEEDFDESESEFIEKSVQAVGCSLE